MSKYSIEDLKDGSILVFNGHYCAYGYITKEVGTLICVYDDGGWDTVKTIINTTDFVLYEPTSTYNPIRCFMRLCAYGVEYAIEYSYIKEVKKEIRILTKEEIAKKFGMELEDFVIVLEQGVLVKTENDLYKVRI